jgi:hypothetical protein
MKATNGYVGLGTCEADSQAFQFRSKLHSLLTMYLKEKGNVFVCFRVMWHFPRTHLQRKMWYSLSKQRQEYIQ